METSGTDADGSSTPAVHLNVPSGRSIPEPRIRRALSHLFRRLEVRAGELSVTFLADGPIRELNREHLAHDWVPDVLSFRLHEPGEALIGDVYVGLEQAHRQAAEHGVAADEELVRLAVHGTLHTLGFDHPEDPDAREDSEHYRLQEEVLIAADLEGQTP